MSDTKYLKLRGNVWFLWYGVPKRLQKQIGKKLIGRSLKTADLKVARRRREEALVEIHRAFADLDRNSPDEWSSVALARQLRAEVQLGILPPENAQALMQDEIERISWRQEVPGIVNGPEGEALLRAMDILDGAGQGLSLSEALGRHLDALAPHVRKQTLNARGKRVQALIAFLKDPPVSTIKRRQIADYVTTKLGPDPRSVKTKRDVVSDIAATFKWFLDTGLIEVHPAQGLTSLVKESRRGVERETRRAWTDAELATLQERLEELKPNDYLRPLVKAAMFSGLRLNEITNLRGRDIEDDCFVIREAKNANSLRRVPIHSVLTELVEDIDDGAFLIPGLAPGGEDAKRGHEASKRFGRCKTKWGFGRELVFHGLRMSFITKLESAGVPQNIAESIVGHARQSMSYGLYSRGVDTKVLREAVEKVIYTG